MMVKKHQWHCGHCGMPCQVAKVSKKHKHLICPHDGIIASNPLPLMALGLAAKYLPTAVRGAKKMLGAKSETPAAAEMRAAGYPQRIQVIKQPILVDID